MLVRLIDILRGYFISQSSGYLQTLTKNSTDLIDDYCQLREIVKIIEGLTLNHFVTAICDSVMNNQSY
jgi:hypothetical protein